MNNTFYSDNDWWDYLAHARSHKYVAKIKGAGKNGKPLYFYSQAAYQAFIKGKNKAGEAAANAVDAVGSAADKVTNALGLQNKTNVQNMRYHGKWANLDRQYSKANASEHAKNSQFYRDRYNQSLPGLIDKAAYNIRRKSGLELRSRVDNAERKVARNSEHLNELTRRRKQEAKMDAKDAERNLGTAAERRSNRHWRHQDKTRGWESYARKDYETSRKKAYALKDAYEKTPLGKTEKAIKNAPSNIKKAAKRATTSEYDKIVKSEANMNREGWEAHTKTPQHTKAIERARKSNDENWDAIVNSGAALDNLGFTAAYAKKAVSSFSKGDTAAGKKAVKYMESEMRLFKAHMLGNEDYDIVGALPGIANATKAAINRRKASRRRNKDGR